MKKEDVILVKVRLEMPGRAIKNPFISHVMAGERVKPKRCLGCLKTVTRRKWPYIVSFLALIKAAKGEIGEALVCEWMCGKQKIEPERS